LTSQQWLNTISLNLVKTWLSVCLLKNNFHEKLIFKVEERWNYQQKILNFINYFKKQIIIKIIGIKSDRWKSWKRMTLKKIPIS
jgi:hypothetical protein